MTAEVWTHGKARLRVTALRDWPHRTASHGITLRHAGAVANPRSMRDAKTRVHDRFTSTPVRGSTATQSSLDGFLFIHGQACHHLGTFKISDGASVCDFNLETAVGRVREGCDGSCWQGATLLRAHAREEEQRRQRDPAQRSRVRSAFTPQVSVDLGAMANVHAVFPAARIGQLPFLGSMRSTICGGKSTNARSMRLSQLCWSFCWAAPCTASRPRYVPLFVIGVEPGPR